MTGDLDLKKFHDEGKLTVAMEAMVGLDKLEESDIEACTFPRYLRGIGLTL
jgi:hypothetical protein